MRKIFHTPLIFRVTPAISHIVETWKVSPLKVEILKNGGGSFFFTPKGLGWGGDFADKFFKFPKKYHNQKRTVLVGYGILSGNFNIYSMGKTLLVLVCER